MQYQICSPVDVKMLLRSKSLSSGHTISPTNETVIVYGSLICTQNCSFTSVCPSRRQCMIIE